MTQEPQKSNVALIVIAIVGVLGTIIATSITVIGNYNVEKLRRDTELTRTALMSIATQNVAIMQTPTANTVAMPSATPTIGTESNQYFQGNCIESKNWAPYVQNEVISPSEKECLELSNLGISAQDNKLLFSVNSNEYITKGIYASISQNTEISFTLTMYKPKIYSEKFSYIGFGVGDSNTEPVSGSFLYFRVDESPATTIETGDWWGTFTNKVMQKYSFNQEYQVVFSVQNNDLSIFVDDKLASKFNLNSKQNFFWISYRVLPDGEIQASVSNFSINSK
jgi:hypothetical protein